MKLARYLISLDLGPQPGHMHAYVMTNDAGRLQQVASKMMEEAEKLGPVMLPILLQTKLDATGDRVVRDELGERVPEAKALMAKADEFHLTMWVLADSDPWDSALMALH